MVTHPASPSPPQSNTPPQRSATVSRRPPTAWSPRPTLKTLSRRHSTLSPSSHYQDDEQLRRSNTASKAQVLKSRVAMGDPIPPPSKHSHYRTLTLPMNTSRRRSESNSLSLFRSGVNEVRSVARRMSLSLRTKSNRHRPDPGHASHAALLSPEKPYHPDHTYGRPQTSWFRSHRPFFQRPSMPAMNQQFREQSFSRPSLNYFIPGSGAAPPVFPDDLQPGAAARAAAAAQNEAAKTLLAVQKNGGSIMTRDSESGIGIDLRERSDREDNPLAVIRRDPVTILPIEIMEHVLTYLDAFSLLQAELVSHLWNDRANSAHVWRPAFQRKFNTNNKLPTYSSRSAPAMGLGKRDRRQHWKQMYHVRHKLAQRWKDGQACAIYLNGHKDSVYCVQFDEHKIITGSRDQTIRVWDAHTYQCIKVIGAPAHPSPQHQQHPAAFNPPLSPTSLHPFCSINTVTRDPQNLNVGQSPLFHRASILCLQFDDEIMVSGSSDHSAIVWSMKTYNPIQRLHGHNAGVLDVCFDDQYVITCSKDTTICAWDRTTGELLKKLCGHKGPVNAVQLRGNLVASASGDGMAKLWNLKSGKCIKEFPSRDRGLACIDFSEDGRTILAGGNDRVIYQFDTNSGALVQEFKGHRDLVRSLHLDSANNRIVSGSYDMSVKVWEGAESSNTGLKLDFQGWTTSWILAAKSDYRRIVATSQDGRAVIVDFGYGLEDIGMLEAS